jgi:hypothetical protein
MSFKYLVSLFWMTTLILSDEHPGFILTVHKSQFLPLFAQALPAINDYANHQTIDVNYTSGFLTLKKFDFHVDPITKEQIEIAPGSEPSSVLVRLKSINQNVLSFVSIDAYVVVSNGTINSTGIIKDVDFLLTAKDFTPEAKGKPYFNFKVKNVTFDVDSFSITADLPYVPGFFINTILSLFKSTVLETIKDSILHIINDNGHEIFDQIINDGYPLSLPLDGFGMELSSRLVAKPFFKYDQLYMYLDGTFYDPRQGYTFPENIKPLDLITDSKHFVDVYLSDYSVKSYMKTLFDKNITSVGSMFNWTLESVVDDETVEIKGGFISIENYIANFKVSTSLFTFNVLTKMQLKSPLMVRKNDQDNYVVEACTNNLTFSDFKIDSSIPYMDNVESALKYVLESSLQALKVLQFPIPKVTLPFVAKPQEIQAAILGNDLRFGYKLTYL